MIEDIKKYWNARPCNLKHSDAEIGTYDYFEEVRAKKYFVESHIIPFADFRRWKNKKVLDLGCGIGTMAIDFALAGAQVTAVDLSSKSLEIARKRAETYQLDNIRFIEGNAEELDEYVPVEVYDLIWSFGVIHHSPNPEKIVEQIKKYMGLGSEFRVMVYNKWSWKVFWILMGYGKGQFWKINELIPKYSEAVEGCPRTLAYSKKTVKKLLNGFKIKDIFVDHIFPYKIEAYKKHYYEKIGYFRWMPDKFFRLMEKFIGWHLCVTAQY